jgi:RNA polymerase sigma-70 factor (ECF subfamily)
MYQMTEGGDHVAAGRLATEPAASSLAVLSADRMDSASLAMTFEEFYEAEHGGLFGALYLISGDRHDAEDLMQEAFLKIWERWDSVRAMENPTGYLYRTAMNAFRMRRRRAAMAARRFARHLTKGEDIERAEARHEVDHALSLLPGRQRAALVLTDLLEFDSNEAGRVLGIKPSTVRKLAQQGRAAMRRAIGGPDE